MSMIRWDDFDVPLGKRLVIANYCNEEIIVDKEFLYAYNASHLGVYGNSPEWFDLLCLLCYNEI